MKPQQAQKFRVQIPKADVMLQGTNLYSENEITYTQVTQVILQEITKQQNLQMVDKHNKMEDRKKTSPMIGKKKELRQLSKK